MNHSKLKYAVVDLEATRASKFSKIIQVGIVIIENDTITETYQTDVNPHEQLSEHIINLTGITDAQLAKAPDFSEVAKHIYDLISDCIFVAHNVKFDANLLSEQLFLEGFELKTPRVDTVELAQVFFPTMEKYNLKDLTGELGISLKDAHTAISDAKATAQLLLKIKQKIKSLPLITLEQVKKFADSLLYESGLVIDDSFVINDYDNQKYQEVNGILLRRPIESSIEKKYADDFEKNIALLGLEVRSQQLAFAQAIQKKQDESIRFVQAQSGIGKTYGYLLPLLADETNEKVIVAVPTKLLQDQIIAGEGKALETTFGTSVHSLKGPANYLKLDVFKQSLNVIDENRVVNCYKMQLLVWLLDTCTGDLDEIRQQQRLQWYFRTIQHDGQLNQNSPFKDVDFWKKSYQKAYDSRLIITNHAYLLTRIEDDYQFITGYPLVIDEAQKFFLALENFSRYQLNIFHTMKIIERELEQPQTVLTQRLLESLQYELNHLVLEQNNSSISMVPSDIWKKICQDLSELNLSSLKSIKQISDSKYTDIWIERTMIGEKRKIELKAGNERFFDFSKMLPENQTVYFVSATLTISPDVDLPTIMGFKHYSQTLIEKEPCLNQELWIDKAMPSPQESTEEYIDALTNRIFNLVQLNRPMIVLFTAQKTLDMVSERLKQYSVYHLAQGHHGSPHQIKKRFEQEDNHVLLGTGSFWEGVDFTNHDRLLLVITRMPFENPEDPLNQKMAKQLAQKNKDYFNSYALPMMLIRLNQAIGRTNRRFKQKSAVLILDSRLVQKDYGTFILNFFKQSHQVSVEKLDKILLEISQFLV